MEHYSAVKRDNLLAYKMTWADTTNIFLNERNQTQKYVPTDSVYRTFWKRQNPSVGIEIRIVVTLR